MMIQQCSYNACKWQELVAWVPVIGLLMVISSIPFEWSAYHRIAVYVLGIGFAADYIVNQRWKMIAWDRSKWIYVIMLAFVALFFIREMFDPTPLTDYAYSQFHLHEWFLYVGLVGLLGFSDKLQFRHVTYVMLVTSVVMLLICGYLYLFTDEMAGVPFFERFNWLRAHHINSHMVMNLYLNAAIILGFSILPYEPSRWRKVLLTLAILCAWIFILLSSGRTGQATSIVVMAVCGWMVVRRHHWYIGVTIGALFAVGIWLFIINNPRVSVDRAMHDPRGPIYNYSWRMVQKEPLTGYGLSTLSVEYVEQAYQDSIMYNGYIAPCIQVDQEFAVLGKTMMTHHAHNAFLHYWLIFGIMGPLLLLALFVAAACMPVGKNYRVYLWLFLLTIFIQCMTEPIGQHIKPQFISIILFVWQFTAKPLPNTKNKKLCES